jgi:hypothetical protein
LFATQMSVGRAALANMERGMSVPSLVQSILALYGLGERGHAPRKRPAPIVIGEPPPRR